MEGFFTQDELAPKTEEGVRFFCNKCGLDRECASPRLKAIGGGKRGILIISGVPDADGVADVRKGATFQFMNDVYWKVAERDMYEDCLFIHAVSCHSEREVTTAHVKHCSRRLWHVIHKIKPKLILLLGMHAVTGYFADRWGKRFDDIHKWRGFMIPDFMAGCYVMPLYHPVEMGINFDDKEKKIEAVLRFTKDAFMRDLRKALREKNAELPKNDASSCVECLTSEREALLALRSIKTKLIAIDYETTGLKPLSLPNHRIVSCGIATSENKAFAFKLDTDELRSALFPILRNPKVKKIGANNKFEEMWTRATYDGAGILGWHWDTVLAAHVLDNRTGICGVKFQALINLGVIGYDDESENYKKSGKSGYNRMEEMPVLELLEYNAMDAVVEYRIAMIQMEQINSMRSIAI